MLLMTDEEDDEGSGDDENDEDARVSRKDGDVEDMPSVNFDGSDSEDMSDEDGELGGIVYSTEVQNSYSKKLIAKKNTDLCLFCDAKISLQGLRIY